VQEFKDHLEPKFAKGMTWDNHGEWHIDHIIPIKYAQDGVPPSIKEICRRLHYTNTQPLWANDNISKGNRFTGHPDDTIEVSQATLDTMCAYI